MSRFSSKTALVTGAGSGIGYAVSLELADGGANVVVTDINLDAAKAVVDKIVADGGAAAAFKYDTTSPEDAEHAVAFAVETYGALNLAVNNAGISPQPGKTGELDLDGWRRVVDINLNGVLYGLRYEIPAMLAAGGGSIVNMSSIHGLLAIPFSNGGSAYVATKHGVVGLTKNAAVEYGRENIRVNAVGPGYIATPLLSHLSEEQEKALALRHPLDRLGTAEEVSHLVCWLLSDEASFVTGSFELVDGGYTAR